MANYQQMTNVAAVNIGCLAIPPTTTLRAMSVGAAVPTQSLSAVIETAGAASGYYIQFQTTAGDPGTASLIGAFTLRLNVTTANSNITWYGIYLCSGCSSTFGSISAITTTSGLSISLGTTGVKTASAEITTTTWTWPCTTATAFVQVTYQISNAATMNATFNWIPNQVITLPVTSSAAPAPSAIFTLAQMNVGQ